MIEGPRNSAHFITDIGLMAVQTGNKYFCQKIFYQLISAKNEVFFISRYIQPQPWTLIVSEPGHFVPGELDKNHSLNTEYHTRKSAEYVWLTP